MKWLALLLVLANVLFYGWRYELQLRESHDLPAIPVPIPLNTPSLRLIAELDELPPLREEGPQAATPVPAQAVVPLPATPEPVVPLAGESENPVAVTKPAATSAGSDTSERPTLFARPVLGRGVASDLCVDIGPFPVAKDADAIEDWLASRATALQRVIQVVRKRQFFWVYLEPKNAQEARANVADLERKGVRDFLLVQRGGLQNAISLGLFSTQDAVNRRLSEMNRQGFQPVVVPRIEVMDLEWLRANLAVGYTASAIPREQLAGAAVQTIDCAKIADSATSQ